MLAIAAAATLGFASLPHDLVTDLPFEHAVFGQGRVVCDRSGANPLVYVEMAAESWTALAGYMLGSDFSAAVPPACEPFNHVFMSYAVGATGHPPWDGRQYMSGGRAGGYGQAHLDAHFATISVAAREALTSDCTVVKPGPKNPAGEYELCDITATDDATLRFLNLPPTQYTRGFRTDDAFGGASIRMHGTHMMPDTDFAPGGPSNCVSTGPNGDWRDCATQQEEGMALRAAGLGRSPRDQNCTCGYWLDGS